MADSENKDQNQSESKSFRVEDKRHFTADGSPMFDLDESRDEEPISREKTKSEATSGNEPYSSKQKPGERPQIDFAAFVLSLATTAIANLGEIPDPGTGKVVENIEAAQQMIDILMMLKDKTKGNLEPDEDNLLENLLYELRMKYLSKTQITSL